MNKINIKTKLVILGICILSLLAIFTVNVVKEYNNRSEDEIILRSGDMITFKEVKHLLHFLDVNDQDFKYKLERKKLSDNIDESGHDNGDFNGEFIESDIVLPQDKDYITFNDLLYLLPSVSHKLDLSLEKILDGISFEIEDQEYNKALLTGEFLEIYENVYKSLPEETSPIKEVELFIIGRPDIYKKDLDKHIMSTNQGNYGFENALDYAEFYIDGQYVKEVDQEDDQENSNENEEDNINEDIEGNNKQDVSLKFNLEDYINCKITGLVKDSDLVYVKEVLDDETILNNVWITYGLDQTVNAFAHGVTKSFHTKSSLSKEIKQVVGDLIIQNQEIVGIRIKPDRINGKVLVTDKKYIEVESYGQIPLDDNYKIYKIYGEIAQEITNSILVGYESTDFIVAEGKIVAALIKEEIKAQNIRVLIKTDQFKELYHDQVSFTSSDEFTVSNQEETLTYSPGEIVSLKPYDDSLDQGRITVKSTSENGKIELLSIERSYGNPKYRGTMEIAPSEKGLLIVNELSLEEYLYAVVPSEMPSYYSIEALKSQAVCARSYAYNHLIANSLKEYGAHVDDSMSYQVYNNIEENEATILAVKDTYGRVMTYEGNVINAYYFSTSSGHTASVGEVWNGDDPYLTGKLQIVSSGDEVEVTGSTLDVDFSNEEAFRNFLLNSSETTYDSQVAWYRWKVTLPYNEITNSINSKIAGRYNANPEYIQTLVTDENGEQVYESQPIESIGALEDVQIITREKSGIITELKLVGSSATVKVIGEYNIRTLLSPENQSLIRQDGSEVSQSMLPSAFFIMDKIDSGLNITGGGYGHGVGMSQNGAQGMAELGNDYQEILRHYYSGIELGFIYED